MSDDRHLDKDMSDGYRRPADRGHLVMPQPEALGSGRAAGGRGLGGLRRGTGRPEAEEWEAGDWAASGEEKGRQDQW